jgi:inner membrane protein
MPTVFTHAFVGGALAKLAPEGVSRTRLALVAGAIAVLPDLDVIAFLLGISYGDPLGHRGASHSLMVAGLLALISARICFPRVGWWTWSGWQLVGILALAAGSHGVLDAFTDGGLGVGFFVPFSSVRYFFPWRPLAVSPIGFESFFTKTSIPVVIDEFVWVWLPILVSLVVVKFGRPQRRR